MLELVTPKDDVVRKSFQLGTPERVLRVVERGGDILVHICQLECTNNAPPKQIYLKLQRWLQLCENLEVITRCVSQVNAYEPDIKLKIHLGGKQCVSVTSDVYCVDIRNHWLKDGTTLYPTRRGIALTFSQWDILQQLMPLVNEEIPELLGLVPCYNQPTHVPQACAECNENIR